MPKSLKAIHFEAMTIETIQLSIFFFCAPVRALSHPLLRLPATGADNKQFYISYITLHHITHSYLETYIYSSAAFSLRHY